MKDEPRPAVFRTIWPPEPTTDAPTSHRLVRLPSRGPWQILLLLAATGIVVTLLPAAILAAATVGAIVPAVVTGLAAAAMLTLLLRAWVRGTYVNEQGYLVRRLLANVSGHWSEVTQMEQIRGRLALHRADAPSVRTQLGSRSLDTLFRPETADMALLKVKDLWAAGTR